MAKLTEKQNRFIGYYIETGNATKAAKLAGYKGKNANRIGSENLSKLGGQIQMKLKELESKRIADGTEVLEYLSSVVRGESETEEVIGCGSGVERVKKKPNERERLKAAELLGKRHGLFTDKVSLSGDVGLEITIDYGEEED